MVDSAGSTAEPATVLTFVLAADVTRGLKSNVSRRGNLPELDELYIGISAVTIALVFDVASFGSITYESIVVNPIPPERLDFY